MNSEQYQRTLQLTQHQAQLTNALGVDENLRLLRAQQNVVRYEPMIRHLPFCCGDARNYCYCETEQSQNGERIDVDHRLWLKVRDAAKWNAVHKIAWFFFGILGGLVVGLIC